MIMSSVLKIDYIINHKTVSGSCMRIFVNRIIQ